MERLIFLIDHLGYVLLGVVGLSLTLTALPSWLRGRRD